MSYKHGYPVHSLAVLLTRKADSAKLTGELIDRIASEPPYRIFRYQVVRAWELDAEKLATGGWGLFPLAPLSDTAPPVLSDLIDQMGRRLANQHPNGAEARTVAVMMDILLGLRYDREMTKLMMEKVMNMLDLRESHGYQLILDEGKAEGQLETLRDIILRQGRIKFGKPSAKIARELNAIADKNRLTELVERVLDVDSWKGLLASKN